ncbi:hypothetical protein D3C86_2160870 [compost metagenome]
MPTREVHAVEDHAIDLLTCVRKPLDALAELTQLGEVVTRDQQHGARMCGNRGRIGGHQHRRAVDHHQIVAF